VAPLASTCGAAPRGPPEATKKTERLILPAFYSLADDN